MDKIVINQNELKSLIENVLNESINNDQVLEGKSPYYILGMVKNANNHTLKDLKTLQNLIDSGDARYDRFFISGYLKGIITSLEQMNEVISNEEADGTNDQDMIGEAKKAKGKKKNESLEEEIKKAITEAVNQDTYFSTFSEAVQTARLKAEQKGYVIDENDWWNEINVGPGKPREGQTFRATIGLTLNGKPQRKALQIIVYNMGIQYNRNYELTSYIN